jgi:hypothetical protein
VEFARETRIPGGSKDENAAEWAEVALPQQDSIDGRWSSRWKGEGGDWSSGVST